MVKSIISFTFIISLLLLVNNSESRNEKLQKVSVKNFQLKDDIQKLFEKFFQKVVQIIINKDPFNYAGFDFDVHSYGIICKGYLKDLSLSSISTIEVTHLKVTENPLRFELGLGFSMLQLIGNFELNFDFLTMLPLYGEGAIGAAVSKTNISIAMDINIAEVEALQLNQLTLNLTMQSMKVDVEKILNNSNLGKYISNIISDISPTFLGSIGNLLKFFEENIKNLINNYLKTGGVTYEKIIEIIKQIVQ